jgi:hypothetical protein
MKSESVRLTLFIISLSLTIQAAAQQQYKKSYGGDSSDVCASGIPVTDGGYIMTGYTKSFGAGMEDVYVVKVDSTGNMLWAKTYGGANTDYGHKIIQSSDGGFVIVGRTESFGANGIDMYVIKTDDTGKVLWSRLFGGYGVQEAFDVKQTTKGGYIIVGNSFNFTFYMPYLIETDGAGNLLWTKTYAIGFDAARGRHVQQVGNCFIVGGTVSKADTVNFWSEDIFLMKTDSAGVPIWTKAYNGAYHDNLVDAKKTNDDGYIVLSFSWDDTYVGTYLLKLDSNGNRQWSHLGISTAAYPMAVYQSADSGYVVAGSAGSSYTFLYKTDDTGGVKWMNHIRNFGATNVTPTDNGYVMPGSGPGSFSNYMTVKTASDGRSCNDTSIPYISYPFYHNMSLPPVSTSSLDSVAAVITLTGYSGLSTDQCQPELVKKLDTSPEIVVYPNPSDGVFKVKSAETIISIELFTVEGKLVYRENVNTKNAAVLITGHRPGLYIYSITQANKVKTGKVVLR